MVSPRDLESLKNEPKSVKNFLWSINLYLTMIRRGISLLDSGYDPLS